VNPRPDLAIKEVEFYTPERKSVPILVGLTAAVKGGSVTVSPETAAKIKKLMDDGKAALKGGRLEDAKKWIEEAIALDPAPAEACRALLDIAEKKGDDDWVLDACRLWVLHGARSPTPHNRMGEILEKRKDLTGALAAYRKSLQTEWNQPPVIEAVKRLETKLK
jgi:tetratricopeptide (TPR) repeat protein